MDSKIVSAMLIFSCLAQVTQFPSINFSIRIRDAAGIVQFLDPGQEVSDCGFCSSFHREDQHIAWETSVTGFNGITGPKIAVAFQYLYGNSTPTAFSVCDVISNQQLLVIICSFTSYEASLIAGIDDFITKALTAGDKLVLPKAKLGTSPSALYMVQHTSRKVLETASSVFYIIQHISWKAIETAASIVFDMIQDIFWKVKCFRSSISSFIEHNIYEWTWPILEKQSGFRSSEIKVGRKYCVSLKDKVLRVGVQVRSNISQLESVNNNFSIRVFDAAVGFLPGNITYKMIDIDAPSDQLVKEFHRKNLDVAIGDIVSNKASRYRDVVFSVPYLEPGFTMVVKVKNNELNQFWWFLSPFTPKMWVIIAAFNVLIGAAIWIVESQDKNAPNFLEVLCFLHRRPLQSDVARILKVLWVFVMLILTQVYTNMLSTMLTNSQRESSILDFDSLRRTNAPIGCNGEVQTIRYLEEVLRFKRGNIRTIASIDKYAEALSSGNIKAAFLLTPSAKALLAEHCDDFTDIKSMAGYNLGGFRFILPRGSPLAFKISQAILALKESGELQLMEEELSSFSNCSRNPIEDPGPIGPSPFFGLFVISGVIAATALLITLIKLLFRNWKRIQRILSDLQLWQWLKGLQQGMPVGRELWPRQLSSSRIQRLLRLPTEIFNDTHRRNEPQLSSQA